MDLDSIFEFASYEITDLFDFPNPEFSLSPEAPTSPNSTTAPPTNNPSTDTEVYLTSTAFHPEARWRPAPPDLTLLSSDLVIFHVHSQPLLDVSENSFRFLIPTDSQGNPSSHHGSSSHPSDKLIHVPVSSYVLNVMLHAIYGLSCSHFAPSFETLVDAVDQLPLYGVDPRKCGTTLSTSLLSHAPLFPLDVYTLAARYDWHDLAVSASPHLLSLKLSTITDEMAKAMGPKYLRKLFFLHMGRIDALKRLLLQPPHPHGPTSDCTFVDQRNLTRAWALASAYIAWDARPDVSKSFLESALVPLTERLTCGICKQSLSDRIKDLVIQWSVVKRTI